MATNYQRGTRLEYRARDALRAAGWFVIRSAGSHGKADLVALKPSRVVLVQAKAGEVGAEEIREAVALDALARELRADAYLVSVDERRRLRWLTANPNSATLEESTLPTA